MADFQFLSIERADAVATVTLQRADKLNALNAQVFVELTQAFTELGWPSRAGEAPVRAAILTGAGKAFIAGADIAEMASMTSTEAAAFSHAGHRFCALLEALPFPVIAAVNGFALGGGLEVALGCDFIYAAEGAKLGQPESSLAVIPGFGGTQRLARRVGIGRARELLYTGDMISAAEALTMGLVNLVVPAAELLTRARATAAKIASRGPLAIQAAKRVTLRGEGADLKSACELEAQAFAALFGSEDQRAGMRAFLDKTKASFQGR